MIKVSIFSIPIFGEFSELLANSVLLPVGSNYFSRLYIYAASNYLPHI